METLWLPPTSSAGPGKFARRSPGGPRTWPQRLGLAILAVLALQASPRTSGWAAPESAPANEQSRPLAFRVPPHARFTAPDAAEITWETEAPCECVLEYGIGEKSVAQVRDSSARSVHRFQVKLAEPKARYQYRVRAARPGPGNPEGGPYELDNSLNYTVARLSGTASPYGDSPRSRDCIRAAERILATTGITRGYCLVLEAGDGQLAYELARRSELIIFGVDNDRGRIARARGLLGRAGAYGSRITLHHAESLGALPLPRAFANLVVAGLSPAGGELPATAAEVASLLQPATGLACLGPLPGADPAAITNLVTQWLGALKLRWALAEAGGETWLRLQPDLPADTGSWTHQYGEAGNTANSREGLQGVAGTGGLGVQWLGRPGADFGIDRNPRMPAPLAVHGRLFHQGMNRIIALDSYNGAVLWSLEIPALRRVNMPRDAANWCADPDHLFVAVQDRCWVIAAGTGELERTLPLAEAAWGASHEWGCVVRADGLLYGSSVKRGSSFTEFWGGESWYDAKAGYGTEKVCSDDLFAVAAGSGERRWRRQEGMVINSTIAAAGGRLVFVECRHPEVKALPTGRIGSAKLWEDQHLVALDAQTGKTLWDQPLDTVDGIVVFYLVAAEDRIYITSSAAGKYHLYAFRAADGGSLWQASHIWPSDNHGGHVQHPVLVRGTLYLEPCSYEAATGRLVAGNIARHEGCATYAATLNALVYRGESRRISMWDIEHGKATSWFNLRPSCWLSTVPANGMILSPEGGGGCSCGNWLETSVGFAPIAAANPQ